MDNETTFKVGDVVRLRSGGPPMTVVSVYDDGSTVDTVRFGRGHDRTLDGIPVAALERVENVTHAWAEYAARADMERW